MIQKAKFYTTTDRHSTRSANRLFFVRVSWKALSQRGVEYISFASANYAKNVLFEKKPHCLQTWGQQTVDELDKASTFGSKPTVM